jgi:hypothetical protein
MLPPQVFESDNLSTVWGQALLYAHDHGRANSAPIVVSISGLTNGVPKQSDEIRAAIDESLRRNGKNSTRITAMTIFPYEMWRRRRRPPCPKFSDLCVNQLFPRLKALNSQNRYGTYFERMMAYPVLKDGAVQKINQLSFAIDLLNQRAKRWPRESAIQIGCFDPARDLTRQPVRGFPCLQQLGISHDSESSIALNAFYPAQYLFDRAYGNYLGLCHLGEFIAHETNLNFTRLNCFIGRPLLGSVGKSKISSLIQLLRERVDSVQ